MIRVYDIAAFTLLPPMMAAMYFEIQWLAAFLGVTMLLAIAVALWRHEL